MRSRPVWPSPLRRHNGCEANRKRSCAAGTASTPARRPAQHGRRLRGRSFRPVAIRWNWFKFTSFA